MAASPSISYVIDSCIWIDMYNGNLLDRFLKLPNDIMSPDVILGELDKPQPTREYLLKLGVQEKTLDGIQIRRLYQLRSEYPNPSPKDLSALVLAESLKINLITGDKDLKNAARSEGVKVNGIIYTIELMLEKQLITPIFAINSLERIIDCGSWLPKKLCRNKILSWQKL